MTYTTADVTSITTAQQERQELDEYILSKFRVWVQETRAEEPPQPRWDDYIRVAVSDTSLAVDAPLIYIHYQWLDGRAGGVPRSSTYKVPKEYIFPDWVAPAGQ